MNRLTAYSMIILAVLVGGGSLLVFGGFLIAGPFTVVRLRLSEPQVLLWDGLLSMLFFLQHSGMIRPSFRAWLSSAIPAYYHSATYAMASGAVLLAVVLLWQPSHTILLEIQGPPRLLFRAVCLAAIAGFTWGVWALGAFDPFGRIAITTRLRGSQQHASRLALRGPYLWIRHPLYFFMLILIWATPDVKADRLLFDVLWTSWIVLGTHLEERDLVAEFGESYRRYQGTVPMLLPWKGPVGQSP